MSAILCVTCKTESEANGYASEAAQGILNGVSLGTTTDVVVVENHLVIRCTPTRAENLRTSFDDPQGLIAASVAPGVTTMDAQQVMFYALGKMDSQ